MNDETKQQLRQAYELVKARKRQEAVAILLPILQQDEENADAWWLLANSLDDPNDAREALENVVRIRPEHDKAQKMLALLNQRYPKLEPEPEPEEDIFGLGDSASDPFTGLGMDDSSAEPAAPVDAYYEAEPAVSDDPFAVSVEDDPFAAPAGDSFAAADDDPFGSAQTFGGTPEPFGGAAEAFGGPAESFGSAEDMDEDPFGAPAAPPKRPAAARTAGSQKPRPRKSAAQSDDPFGDTALAGPVSSGSRRSSSAKKSGGGTNPLVLLLAIIGGISLVVCLGCGVISLAAPAVLSNVGGQVIQQLESEGFVLTLEASSGSIESIISSSVSDAIARGSLNYGDARRDTLGTGQQHAWTFSGSGGDRVLIEMRSTSGDGLDAYLSLFNASGAELASDDDSGGDLNARLAYTLPGGGTYTIVARSFGFTGGAYELRLNRQ